jgi:hypothetical protein
MGPNSGREALAEENPKGCQSIAFVTVSTFRRSVRVCRTAYLTLLGQRLPRDSETVWINHYLTNSTAVLEVFPLQLFFTVLM